jgi:signal transduction histidine kinase
MAFPPALLAPTKPNHFEWVLDSMGIEISCPRCGKPVQMNKRYCDHCGVNLMIAAALAEQEVLLQEEIFKEAPRALEALVPRIGEYMVEQGVLRPDEIQRAVDYQKERAAAGAPILLGQSFLELGLVDRETLDRVVTQQVLKLQTALSEANKLLAQRVKERTRELQKALERLSELNRLKSNFIANISHELRTPLTHIKGYLDLLVEGGLGSLNPQQSEAFKVIQRAEDRLERLIEDLIQFSLASRGELSLNLDGVYLNSLIKIIVERSIFRAKNQDISLSYLLPESLPPVRADEDKIGWVLQQLVDNALKFTPKGGKVAVKASLENGLVTVAVMDSGIGIPKERVTEIFEPFHQLDGDATRRYSGTGLGLTMVRRIVEAHGAEIKVRSAPGKGSRFEFSLPTATGSA